MVLEKFMGRKLLHCILFDQILLVLGHVLLVSLFGKPLGNNVNKPGHYIVGQ
jgi:hypothetical protein